MKISCFSLGSVNRLHRRTHSRACPLKSCLRRFLTMRRNVIFKNAVSILVSLRPFSLSLSTGRSFMVYIYMYTYDVLLFFNMFRTQDSTTRIRPCPAFARVREYAGGYHDCHPGRICPAFYARSSGLCSSELTSYGYGHGHTSACILWCILGYVHLGSCVCCRHGVSHYITYIITFFLLCVISLFLLKTNPFIFMQIIPNAAHY